jgi:hypothetical protein
MQASTSGRPHRVPRLSLGPGVGPQRGTHSERAGADGRAAWGDGAHPDHRSWGPGGHPGLNNDGDEGLGPWEGGEGAAAGSSSGAGGVAGSGGGAASARSPPPGRLSHGSAAAAGRQAAAPSPLPHTLISGPEEMLARPPSPRLEGEGVGGEGGEGGEGGGGPGTASSRLVAQVLGAVRHGMDATGHMVGLGDGRVLDLQGFSWGRALHSGGAPLDTAWTPRATW